MASLMIVQLSCDRTGCSAEWTGEGYQRAEEAGWRWGWDDPDRDLCPAHTVDPDDLGCCS